MTSLLRIASKMETAAEGSNVRSLDGDGILFLAKAKETRAAAPVNNNHTKPTQSPHNRHKSLFSENNGWAKLA